MKHRQGSSKVFQSSPSNTQMINHHQYKHVCSFTPLGCWILASLHEHKALFFLHPCIQCVISRNHPVSQSVFTCALNTLLLLIHTHPLRLPPPYLSFASLCVIPTLVCGMPSSQGSPPVLCWHRLQGPGHIWSLREGDAHGVLRARGKLETVMNWSVAGGRTDTKGLSVQRMCPSKQSYLWSRTQGKMKGLVVGWADEDQGKWKQAEWRCRHVRECKGMY